MVKHTLSDVLCIEIRKSLDSGISKDELEKLVSKEITFVNLEEYVIAEGLVLVNSKSGEVILGTVDTGSKKSKVFPSSRRHPKSVRKYAAGNEVTVQQNVYTHSEKKRRKKKSTKRKIFKRVFNQKTADIYNARTPEEGHFKAVTGMLAAGFMASQKFSTKQIAKFLQKHNIPKYGLSNRGYKHIKVSDGSYYRYRSITQMLQRYNPRNYKAFMDENNQHGFISLGKAEGFKLIGNVPMALESRDPALWHELFEMTTKPSRKKYPLYHGWYAAKQKKSK